MRLRHSTEQRRRRRISRYSLTGCEQTKGGTSPTVRVEWSGVSESNEGRRGRRSRRRSGPPGANSAIGGRLNIPDLVIVVPTSTCLQHIRAYQREGLSLMQQGHEKSEWGNMSAWLIVMDDGDPFPPFVLPLSLPRESESDRLLLRRPTPFPLLYPPEKQQRQQRRRRRRGLARQSADDIDPRPLAGLAHHPHKVRKGAKDQKVAGSPSSATPPRPASRLFPRTRARPIAQSSAIERSLSLPSSRASDISAPPVSA